MFQIAAAYSLALDNNDECAFKLDYPVINQGNEARNYKDNIFKNIKELPLEWRPESYWREPYLNFHQIPFSLNLMIEGYFGSEQYFAHHREEIIRLFKPDTENFSTCATLHVRRGDYLCFQNIHRVLPLEYYTEALKRIDARTIYVMSDDIGWCRKNLKDERLVFSEQEDWEDLYLMAACKYNIIANSTFSWWGAWLNENPDKVVIAPSKWHTENICKDIYCDNWILI